MASVLSRLQAARRALPTWVWLLSLTAGGLLGHSYAEGWGRLLSQGSPPGWSRSALGMPFRAARVTGWAPLQSDLWSLDHQQSLFAQAPAHTLSLTLTLPEHGALWIQPSVRPAALAQPSQPTGGFQDPLALSAAPTLLLERGSDTRGGRAEVGIQRARGWEALTCTAPLPLPTEAPYPVRLAWDAAGLQVTAGEQQALCSTPPLDPGGVPVLRSGLRRVQWAAWQVDDRPIAPPLSPGWLWLWAGLGGLLALGVTLLEALGGVRVQTVCLGWVPALLSPLLLALPWVSLSEALRTLALTSELAGPQVALAACGILKGLVWLARGLRGPGLSLRIEGGLLVLCLLVLAGLQLRTAGALGALLVGAGAGLGYLALRAGMRRLVDAQQPPLYPLLGVWLAAGLWTAWLGASAPLTLGLLLAAGLGAFLLWLNLHAAQIRAFNGLSLMSVVLLLVSLEWGLQWSDTAQQQWLLQLQMGQLESVQQLQALDGAALQVPLPAKYPPAGPLPRLVCMGGSSTAGALGQQNLGIYYPARLGELTGGAWEVLNQGAAGWTSHHIVRYLDRAWETLQPRILLLYVGYNDRFVQLPVSLARLEAQLAARPSRLSGLLSRSMLYRGLSQGVLGLARWGRLIDVQAAVSPGELEASLRHLQPRLAASGTELVLVREVVWPDSALLDGYAEVMGRLAEEDARIHHLDPSGALLEGGEQLFIDDVHLTEAGHAALAQWLYAALREEGLLSAP